MEATKKKKEEAKDDRWQHLNLKATLSSRKWSMSKAGRFLRVSLCFSRGAFGLENNCQNIILRNSEDQCSPSKVCVCMSSVADKTSLSISSLPCRFSFPAAPALRGGLSEQDEVAEQEGDACSGHLHHGLSNGEMWLPAPSPSQGDTLQARGVKAIMSICRAKPVWSCS